MVKIITPARPVDGDEQKIDEILERGTIVEILPTKKDFRDKLLGGEKLKFYIGFDATAPTLHLSHAKNFILMEKFRKLGHEIIILFGDFTARIGDPTGENLARKQLSREEVMSNIKKWKKLVEPLMNFKDKENPPKIMYNNDWLSKLNLEDIISLASNFTVQQMIARDMFQKRLKEEKPIYMHEFLYPLMQGYDSVAMEVDAEVCGTDQIFNALAGRTLLKKLKNKNKYVIAVTLMENPKTGELMSKSKGVGVFLDAAPNDMYGQIMKEPDEMTEILFINNTYLSLEEIKNLKISDYSKDAKMRLAFEIVKIFYGKHGAKKAEENFIKLFSKKEFPDDIQIIKITKPIPDLVYVLLQMKVASSKTQSWRLIKQGAVEINGKIIDNPKYQVEQNDIIRAGKKYFAKIVLD